MTKTLEHSILGMLMRLRLFAGQKPQCRFIFKLRLGLIMIVRGVWHKDLQMVVSNLDLIIYLMNILQLFSGFTRRFLSIRAFGTVFLIYYFAIMLAFIQDMSWTYCWSIRYSFWFLSIFTFLILLYLATVFHGKHL